MLLTHRMFSCSYKPECVKSQMLCTYLSQRKQYVQVNGHESDGKSIDLGVPQGSVLGHLFINLFIHDVINAASGKKVFLCG